ncbi:Xaa-Pro dipeptidyl-peptidase [Streptomyces sp. SID13031]|uniref:Xaa-Pro dipeptidyl-peptidase n=1 Tax=Streptomyces sp. SID13031 TaxID=2706046 RepID=UPI0013CB50F6|nr:Xaa-Pro dipeptidyl-peptidase [Streptomyces sp. SID13031]NEA34521.1 Xaa-Pro dipeptidyl-peptidase [Streptomyces sp. SID13031]
MRRRVRAVTGAAAVAALVGTALIATPPATAQAQGPRPTFVNGLAQGVFSTNPADWYSGEVWVQAPFDSDRDGQPDRIHADFTAPREVLTDGLQVPVIFEDSPYYAGLNDAANWEVDHPLGRPPADRVATPFQAGSETSPVISTRYESQWVPRGFAVVHAESPGTGHSDGCPTSGGTNETLAGKAVIDWLNGRAPAYTTRDGDTPAVASWTTGKVGMMGTSYNGTIPEAVATTGVAGLEAIVPISAISDWYDYYRANGLVRAPGGFQGEDLDVLADAVYSRLDETTQRTICQPVLDELKANQDRVTGDRSSFWQERNYLKDVRNVHAATLIAHGNNDFNVMTKHTAQFYDALKKQGVPHMFYFHQGGHGGAPPDVLINYWFTRYLYGVQNGVEQLPRSWVVREPASCPARQSVVTGDQANTATLTVADTSAFRIGFTLTVPQTNANGTTTNTTRLISDIPDATHLVLTSAVATGNGQKVAGGTVVNLVCGAANPTPYAEWPDPATTDVNLRFTPGGTTRGGLTLGKDGSIRETLIDNPAIDAATSANAAASDARLIYQTEPLTKPVRISGTPTVSLKVAFNTTKANLSVALVSYAPTGAGVILTRGWTDPANSDSDWHEQPLRPGATDRYDFDLQPKDTVVPAGNRLALMILSTDHDFTIRPAPGTNLTLNLHGSTLNLPVVGGRSTFASATTPTP